MSHKITPFIRVTEKGEEIAQYYVDIFTSVQPWSAAITKTNPAVTSFEIYGQSLATLIGWPNPSAAITPAVSLSLWIKDKDQTKQIWDKLSQWGLVMMEFADYPRSAWYGRCNDKYGVSRQIMYDNRTETTDNKLIPSLMFTGANNGKAQEAMNLYTSLFPASKIESINTYGDMWWPDAPNNIAHAEFTLVNQLFIAMDSTWPHQFNFTDGISFAVSCIDQAEIDYYWNALILDGGEELQCGRWRDKYGVTWQIFPLALPESLFQEDKEKAQYAMQAMMKMKKIIIADLIA